MPKPKKPAQKVKKPLDTLLEGKRRGRPGAPALQIEGRAHHYRVIFGQIWDAVGEALLKAQNEENVLQAFKSEGRYFAAFEPIAALVLKLLHDPGFPRTREAQINFLADSLAGLGWVSSRRSRDICAEVRAKQKQAHHIIRYEFYVECSCGYKGPARENACKKCKTKIEFGFGSVPNLI